MASVHTFFSFSDGVMPELSLAQEVLCASVSGCFSTVLGHPLDCIKVHQQTTGLRPYRSVTNSACTHPIAPQHTSHSPILRIRFYLCISYPDSS